MTDEQLIEKIAEMLFTHDFEQEIDAWEIYDSVESIFMTHRPKLREKYLNWAKDEELRLKEQEIMELTIKLAIVKRELESIKENI